MKGFPMVMTVSSVLLDEWQELANQAAEAAQVPAALVMRVWPEQIEVLIASLGDENPYEEHEKADLGTGLYCETVMATHQPLLVPDALSDPEWANNPDIKLNMISYLGVPLVCPDDSIFGTVCVLDRQPRHYDTKTLRMLESLKAIIESDFHSVVAGDPIHEGSRSGSERRAFQNCIADLRASNGSPSPSA
ncbi:GAF domain-containing protein [Ectopseudomonas khazarica]|uniref:GAF domain-containing protein n=1 Tax=Ectopseudomonas khazarica TaxID=2502979 RepID=UPI003A9198AB